MGIATMDSWYASLLDTDAGHADGHHRHRTSWTAICPRCPTCAKRTSNLPSYSSNARRRKEGSGPGLFTIELADVLLDIVYKHPYDRAPVQPCADLRTL